jgi:hypothetical protein
VTLGGDPENPIKMEMSELEAARRLVISPSAICETIADSAAVMSAGVDMDGNDS